MSKLTELEKQQLKFDWRYKGVSVLNLLTEKEVDKYSAELERIRRERQENNEKGEWGEYDPYQYPHKESDILKELLVHPKIIEATELLLGGEIVGLQTWAYFKPPGQLGRDQHQNIFYTECESNEVLNVSIAFDNHDPQNGSVWYYEGSHNLGVLPIEVDDERTRTNPKNWRNERGKPIFIPGTYINGEWVDKYPKEYLPCKPGSVTLIHSHVLHGSEENNTTDMWRMSFLAGYIAKGTYVLEGHDMNRQPIDV